MTPKPTLRESRLVHAAVGASMLAIPASAAALADTPHSAAAQSQGATGQSGSTGAIQVTAKSHRIRFGRDVVLTGHAPSSQAGQTVVLDFAGAGSSNWRELASGKVRRDGGFRLAAPLRRSGSVKVTSASQPSSSPVIPLALAASSSSNTVSSAPERIAVAAAIHVPARSINVLGGQTVNVRGKLLPGAAGRRVRLQGLRSGRWATLAVGRTGARGGFALHYLPSGIGQQRLRVRFAGDRWNAGASGGAVTLTVYRQSVASWYDDGGNTACGFHAYYGVANVSLPCGTKVSFMYGGRSVTAVVDDRGPYVGGRVWDLNQNTAAALGFGGVDNVWSSI
jgi:rare lipoprotein A